MGKNAGANARNMTNHRNGASRGLLSRKAREQAAVAVGDGEALEARFPLAVVTDAAAAAAGAADVETTVPAEGAGDAAEGTATLEYIEPAAPDTGAPAEVQLFLPSPPSELPAAAPADQSPPPPAAWSEEDERAFQALSARRKAAGFQKRGRDVSAQLLKVGELAPGADTVFAVVAETVKAAGPVGRGDLLDMLMAREATAKLANKPRAWWQGYVAGALRDGFIATVSETAAQ